MAKKILLADDSITIQKVVELTFSDGDYEVTAVNNGAKAIAKLSEFRPDIILSDIIMPEKNGYEVCEFVKSHPEYKSIPVVLLTGTFEPFDPDRADKAGCDAVVTKPFESQSLIHKVEELISQSRSAASAPAPPAAAPEPAESPWMDEPAAPASDDSPFSSAGPEPFTHGADVFGAAQPPTPTMDMPFDSPAESALGGETRAFPRMTFDELQQTAAPSVPPPSPAPAPPSPAPEAESSPWDEAPAFGGETRAFPRMTFDEMQQMANAATPAATPEPDESPFGAPPPPEEFSGETRAFPRMSLEELRQLTSSSSSTAPASHEPEPPAAVAEEAAPWDEQPSFQQEEPASQPDEPAFQSEEPAFSGETRAFPRMTFDELQQQMASPAPTPEPEPEAAPWDEPSAFGGETRAFPRMTFDELQQMASSPAPEPASVPTPVPAPIDDEPWEEPVTASWSPMPEETPVAPEEETPFAAEEDAFPTAVNNQITDDVEQITDDVEQADVNPQITDVNPQITDVNPQITDLTDEQIDRIARRVVQLMSDQVVRNIAWEVIPDLAEMVVKERIRQLEAE